MPKETKISCKLTDAQLFKVLTVAQAYLQAKEVNWDIEELRVDSKFVYFIRVIDTGLEGYIGRDCGTTDIAYMVMDASRIKWAESEGFTRQEAFEKVGVFIHASNMSSFLNWILGEPNYKLKGDYIVPNEQTKKED